MEPSMTATRAVVPRLASLAEPFGALELPLPAPTVIVGAALEAYDSVKPPRLDNASPIVADDTNSVQIEADLPLRNSHARNRPMLFN